MVVFALGKNLLFKSGLGHCVIQVIPKSDTLTFYKSNDFGPIEGQGISVQKS